MTRPDPRLAALAGLAAMVRDARLAALHRATAATAAAEGTRSALRDPPPLGGDEGVAGPALAAARLRWVAVARTDANARLAASRAEEIMARDAAARALGRAEALRRLRDRGR